MFTEINVTVNDSHILKWIEVLKRSIYEVSFTFFQGDMFNKYANHYIQFLKLAYSGYVDKRRKIP
jgi:hypothetical protein